MKSAVSKTQGLGLLIVTLGACFYFYEYFLRVAPSVMQPQLMQSFKIDATLFGTLSAFYFYAYTPMQLVVGILVDRLRLRHILTLAILSCALGSFMLAMTHDYSVAIIGRFLQGFGSAFAFVGALRLAANWLPAERFAFFSGFCASLGFLGAAFAQIILTGVVDKAGWRSTIQSFTFIGIILAIIVWIVLRHKSPQVLAAEKAQQSNKNLHIFSQNIRNFIAILKLPRVWFTALVSCLMFLPTSVFAALWGIPYITKLHHYDHETAALAISMIFIGWAIGAPIIGWISDRLNMRMRIVGIGALLAAVLVLPLLYVAALPFVVVCSFFLLFGICSSVQVLTFAVARDLSPIEAVGTAVAFVNTLAMLGGMIFQRGVGKLLDAGWRGELDHTGVRIYSIADYQHAIVIIPAALILGMIIAFAMKDRVVAAEVKRPAESVDKLAVTAHHN